jgi:hypothetical protein
MPKFLVCLAFDEVSKLNEMLLHRIRINKGYVHPLNNLLPNLYSHTTVKKNMGNGLFLLMTWAMPLYFEVFT